MTKDRPTAEGFKRHMEASGHAPLRFYDVVSRGLYFRVLMCERAPINTSGHGRKNRRRQRAAQLQ
jgi:hypothetical protein